MSINLGVLGEDIACRYLKKLGFYIVDRNFRKKWGEIDIIAKKSGNLHFVEVKSVSCENIEVVFGKNDTHNPEDNIHKGKLKRLSRVIQSYLIENKLEDHEWQFDTAAVFIDIATKKARVRYLSDIVL